MSNSDTSESGHEPDHGIEDDQLPDDLQPSEDNPLAEGLEDRETAGDLLEEGKGAERGSDKDQDKDRDRDEEEREEPDGD